jgi:hypothetical protein
MEFLQALAFFVLSWPTAFFTFSMIALVLMFALIGIAITG